MMLLADAGNARIKWALADAGGPGACSAVPHDAEPRATLARVLAGLPEAPREIVLVDVSGRIDDAGFDVPLRRVIPSARCAGVSNAYSEPSRLGADRWAALLAARALAGGAACVVDCGSAVTIDLLDGRGRHLGGAIAPGPRLQRFALHRGTAMIELPAEDDAAAGGEADWGRDTAAAVACGARLAVAGFVTAGVAEARRVLGDDMQVLLTGGDAVLARAHVGMPFTEVPDLVLQGAWIWAGSA